MSGDIKPPARSEPQAAETEPKTPAAGGTPPTPTAEVTPPAAAPAPPKAVETPAKAAETAPGRKCALVIDDEPANRDFLVRLLEQAKLEVFGAGSGEEAIKIAECHETMALVVIDNKLPDTDGVALLIKMRERYPQARMVMATMLDERALMAQAFENGCNVFLVKPHGFMELFRRIMQSGIESDDLNRMIIDQYGPRPYRG
jgi:CheY-like chemotaxis protein